MPTVADSGPVGAVRVSDCPDETTVMITDPCMDVNPSVTVKTTVKVPVCDCVGVQVKVPLGAIPDAPENVAPVGS